MSVIYKCDFCDIEMEPGDNITHVCVTYTTVDPVTHQMAENVDTRDACWECLPKLVNNASRVAHVQGLA